MIFIMMNGYMTKKCMICGKDFLNQIAMNRHLTQAKKHNMTIKQYSEVFKTEEWVKCFECGIEWFLSIGQQKRRKKSNDQIRCYKCAKKNAAKKMKENGHYVKAGIRLNGQRKESGRNHEISLKSIRTRKDRLKEIALKGAKTRLMKDPESYIKIGQKSNKTKEERNVYELHRMNGTSELILRKRIATMKKNNSFGKSKMEDNFFELLNKSVSTIERQVSLSKIGFKNYSADFFVNHNNNVFIIYFDGIYYHGLDRPISEIAKCKTPTDKIIFDTYYRDVSINEFCRNNNINIMRFDEKEVERFNKRKTTQIKPYYIGGTSGQLDQFIKENKLPFILW